MSSLLRLTRWLGIRADEHARFGWLFVHSLFNGICTAFLFSAAYALFLERYDAEQLPWAYVASALVGFALVRAAARLERRLAFPRLLMSQLYFVLLLVLAFWGAARSAGGLWPAFLIFASTGPLLTLLELEYWGIAVRFFDLRQGKRLFNLITTGGVVSSVAGFFLVPVMVRTGLVREIEDLLLFAALGVGLSIVAVREIGRRFPGELEMRSARESEHRGGRLGALLRDRYFVLISVLMAAFTLTLFLIDLSFMSVLEVRFPQGVALAQFVGWFYGTVKLLELAFRTLGAGRLLSRFGIGFGLTVLPVILLVVGALALAAGHLGADFGLLFSIVASIKLVWLVLRKGLFDGAFKVLYQPLRGEEKFAFQARIEGTVSPAVTLAVGGALLLVSRDGVTAIGLISLLVPLLAIWLVAAALLHRAYRNRLLEALERESEEGASDTPVDAIRRRLLEASPEQLDYFSGLLEKVDASAVPAAMVELARVGPPELVVRALRRIDRRRDVDSLEAVELCVAADDPRIRAAAGSALDNFRRIADLAQSERIEPLLRSPEPDDRELAAIALGWSEADDDGELAGLLWDREPAVRRAALLAAGRLRDPRFWPRIVSHLDSPRFGTTATTALIQAGEPVLPELQSVFGKVGQGTDVRLRILNVYEHAGRRATELIVDKLRYPDESIRLRALASLSHGGYRLDAGEAPAIKNRAEALIASTAWNLAAILDLGEKPETLEVVAALESENRRGREELLLLLSLLFDSRAVGLARQNLDGARESVVYALEILDEVVSADLRPLLFPLLEDLTPAAASSRLESFFPRQRMSRLERLGAITFRERDAISVWTRACALQAIAELSPGRVDDVLVANLFHPEPMLQQVAAAGIRQVDRAEYDRHVARLPPDARDRLGRVRPEDGDGEEWQRRSAFGQVAALREVKGIATLPWRALTALAAELEEIEIDTGDAFPPSGEPADSHYVVVRGRLGWQTEAGGMAILCRGSLAAFPPGMPPCRALEASRAFRLTGDRIYELAVAHVDLASQLLEAASPRAVEEMVSLSRSFETSLSFAPSH